MVSLGAIVLAPACRDPQPRAESADQAKVVEHGEELPYGQTRADISALALEQMRVSEVVGISLALVDRGEIAWATGWGMADAEHGREAGSETIYALGSLAKPVTATAVLQAVERGELELGQSLAELLPELALADGAEAGITLEDLLTHQSGLPSDWFVHALSEDPPPWTAIVSELEGLAPTGPARELTRYSNVGVTLAGAALQRASGRPFEALVTETVLRPAGMDRAWLGRDPARARALASAYRKRAPQLEPVFRMTPAGGLHGSVEDLARFAIMILARGRVGDHRLLSAASVDAMLAPRNAALTVDFDERYGYGWFLDHAKLAWAGRVAFHCGQTFHHHACLMILPEHELAVAVTSNSLGAGRVVGALAVETLISALQEGRALEAPSPAPPRPSLEREPVERFIAAHAGDYVTSMGLARIEAEAGQVWSRELSGSTRLHLDGPDGGTIGSLPGARLVFLDHGAGHLLVIEREGKRQRGALRLEPPAALPQAWRARVGTWELVVRPGEVSTVSEVELVIVDGRLRVEFVERLLEPPMSLVLVLEPIDDSHARIAGLARGQGDLISVIGERDEQRLMWSGTELRRAR